MDLSDLFVARIRALQGMYPSAHEALLNWGRWSRDLRKVYPGDIGPTPTFREADPNKFGDFGEEHDIPPERLAQPDLKPEPREVEPYDERQAYVLDERIHRPGGLSQETRYVIRTAYVSRLHESQYRYKDGPDRFCERLEEALRWAGRFV